MKVLLACSLMTVMMVLPVAAGAAYSPFLNDMETALKVSPPVMQADISISEVSTEAELEQALAREPGNARILAQRGFLRLRQGKSDLALADLQQALGSTSLTNDERRNISFAIADILARRGEFRHGAAILEDFVKQGDPVAEGKHRAFSIAGGRKDVGLPSSVKGADAAISESDRITADELVSIAYDMIRVGRDGEALSMFAQAESFATLSANQAADAAYAARRTVQNDVAAKYLEKAIDLWHSAPEDRRPFGKKELFGLRRLYDDLQRRWGVRGSSTSVINGGFSQGVVEAYFQPDFIGYRNGAQFQLFASAYQTLYAGIGVSGVETAQSSLGLRWKPLGKYNLVLTAERLIKLGKLSTDDTLLRIGYSTDRGTDLNPVDTFWLYYTLFTEAAYFIDQERSVLSGEGRLGFSHTLVPQIPNFFISLFGVVNAQRDSAAIQPAAVAGGAGLAGRYWFREDRYRAPASWIDLSLQHRSRMSDSGRNTGTFLLISFSL